MGSDVPEGAAGPAAKSAKLSHVTITASPPILNAFPTPQAPPLRDSGPAPWSHHVDRPLWYRPTPSTSTAHEPRTDQEQQVAVPPDAQGRQPKELDLCLPNGPDRGMVLLRLVALMEIEKAQAEAKPPIYEAPSGSHVQPVVSIASTSNADTKYVPMSRPLASMMHTAPIRHVAPTRTMPSVRPKVPMITSSQPKITPASGLRVPFLLPLRPQGPVQINILLLKRLGLEAKTPMRDCAFLAYLGLVALYTTSKSWTLDYCTFRNIFIAYGTDRRRLQRAVSGTFAPYYEILGYIPIIKLNSSFQSIWTLSCGVQLNIDYPVDWRTYVDKTLRKHVEDICAQMFEKLLDLENKTSYSQSWILVEGLLQATTGDTRQRIVTWMLRLRNGRILARHGARPGFKEAYTALVQKKLIDDSAIKVFVLFAP